MGGIGKFDKNIPRIAPRPEPSETFRQNIQCLDGIWEFCHRSKEEVCKSDGPAEGNNWNCIEVPSFISATADRAEGFTGVYSYRRTISLLLEWEDTVKILKFEGINGHAKVYVDEKLTGEHRNGFLTWTMDITEACRGKKQITLQVDVEELTERIGTFYHGGIIHSTWLYLLLKTYISMLHMSVSLDEEYKDAVLTTDYSVQASLPDCMAEGTLLDPFGMVVPEGGFCKSLSGSEIDERVSVKILSPLLWDAEHPRLYTMCIRICQGGAVLETVEKKFGFRQIERRANQVFVNGREVKLRGVCRHEVSALHGRCITPELIERDVKLFKEANCNYIRTSHYSPSEYFLDVCDREGIYVEDELGLAFIAKNTDFTQRDPGETERFFSHFREAMARDYSHPCVLIWSLCNESFGGYNFDQLNRLVHETDPTRLTKFSYPMTMQLEHEPVDVWSIHYTNQDVDLSEKRDNVSVGAAEGKDVPVLHDEYAHIPCYNREEHRRDPNVRNFWGESIKRFWDKIWNTKGALGGAIWAGIDETDVYSGGNTQLEWGIIDIWRRRKPEFYLVRKAYSPIVIHGRVAKQTSDKLMVIEVENRFCHTDLSETSVHWKVGEKSGTVSGPQIPPRCTGVLCLKEIPEGETLELLWRDAWGRCVDEYSLQLKNSGIPETRETDLARIKKEPLLMESWKVRNENHQAVFTWREDQVIFDRETARIQEGRHAGKLVLIGGPDLNMNGVQLGRWRKEEFRILEGEEPAAVMKGWYGKKVKVTFTMRFMRNGEILSTYHIDKLGLSMPDRMKLRVSVSPGGLNEIGQSFLCAPNMDALTWERRGAWTVYPKDHIGRNQGTAYRFSRGSVFGQEPEIAWKDEMQNWILNGKYDVKYLGTNDFRSQKENINWSVLWDSQKKSGLTVFSEGSHSVRVQVEEPEEGMISCLDEQIRYTGEWSCQDDPRAGEEYREMWAKKPGCAAEFSFDGTGIIWYGPVDLVCGCARVYVDNVLMDARIIQRVAGVDFPGSADGYDKKFHYPIYSVEGLPQGRHTIRIEALGDGTVDSQDTYIILEKFRILKDGNPEPVRFYINNRCAYPFISWGNYCRPPIMIQEGYENHAVIRLEAYFPEK